jgi:hypothetical protein
MPSIELADNNGKTHQLEKTHVVQLYGYKGKKFLGQIPRPGVAP